MKGGSQNCIMETKGEITKVEKTILRSHLCSEALLRGQLSTSWLTVSAAFSGLIR